MPKSDAQQIHLYIMEDFLPVGMAIVERAKKGGASKIVEAFTSVENPFDQLRLEGSLSAQIVREKLDQIRPGLGNPVVDVTVTPETEEIINSDSLDHKTLVNILNRMDARINAIQSYFDDFKD